MLRVSNGVAAGIVAAAMLLGRTGQVAAQTPTTSTTRSSTTTTSTTTTTTTTLLPHPFSTATGACLRKARAGFKACRRGADHTTCLPQFQTDFPNCFAAGAGVTCAKRCVSREATCLTAVPTTKKNCRIACATTRKADVKACKRIANGDNLWAGGDAACLGTAQANFALCRFVCGEARLDCHVTLKFCIANCTNL